jgi:hypothetical protein
LDADVAFAEFAGDFDAEVFRGNSQFFVAVSAGGVESFRFHARAGEVDLELTVAVFAGDSDTGIFSVDAELFRTVRTEQIISCNFDVDHVVISFNSK